MGRSFALPCLAWSGAVKGCNPRIDGHQSFAPIIEAPTAPRPVAWVINKLISDRIGVYVVKFFEHFCAGIDVEIVIAALQETAQQIFLVRKTQAELALQSVFPGSHTARKSLLEDLDDFGGRNGSRFADEQVKVFWHDDIADESKGVASADFLENLHSKISGAGGGEEWSSLVAAEGDEVKVAASGNAVEILGHRREEGPILCLPAQAGKKRKGKATQEVRL